jgi:hypothetical protein
MTQTGGVAGRLSDWISLGVLASWVPRDAVDEAVQATARHDQNKSAWDLAEPVRVSTRS